MWRGRLFGAASRELADLAAPAWSDPAAETGKIARAPGVRVSFGRLARFVTWLARADGLTLGRRVFVSRATWRDLERGARGARALLAHELVHVEQYLRLGWLGFLARYFGEYLAGRRQGLDHRQAYMAISLEREARRRAARFGSGPHPRTGD